MWNLPGPRALLEAVARDVSRGRHVAVVLPRFRLEDPDFSDTLASRLLELLHEAGRDTGLLEESEAAHQPLAQTLSEALYCEHPAFTVPELLRHPEAADRVLVVPAARLHATTRPELPAFLVRLVSESRAVPSQDRLGLVVICGHDDLPDFPSGGTDEVQFTSHWWWNRLSRWDVGALVAVRPPPVGGLPAVVRDVLDESVVELARWDTRLAEHLAIQWRGNLDELPALIGTRGPAESFAEGGSFARPSADQLEPWDEGLVDAWHGSLSPHVRTLEDNVGANSRIWAAQARVLLPWIEQKRSTVEQRTRATLGTPRFESALDQLFSPALDPAEPVEVGPLVRIIRLRLGDRHRSLASAARGLRDARNRLAHLSPLRVEDITALAAACQTY